MNRLPILGAVIVLIAGLAISCSDKTFITTSTTVPTNADPTAYAPLVPGLRITYTVLGENGHTYEVEVSDPVTVAGNSGYQIRQVDRTAGTTFITYRYTKGDALFESASLEDPGQRILDGPFVAGNSWNVYDTTTSPGGTTNDGGEDQEWDGKGGSLTLFGDRPKVLPGQDPDYMTIIGFEDVQAFDGVTYGHCLKVARPSEATRTSYYWYAAGIGLIKYEANASLSASTNSSTVSIMTSYQTVEY